MGNLLQLRPDAPWRSLAARELFDRLPDAALVVRVGDGSIVDCNAAAAAATGYAPAELVGWTVCALADPDNVAAAGEAWQAMQSAAAFRQAEVTLRCKNGHRSVMIASGSPLPDRQGYAGHGLTILRDATQQRQAENALQAHSRQWRRLAYDAVLAQGRERERIAAGLHDDIGQTLAMVGFKLGELRQAAPSGAATTLIDELRGLIDQASRATRTATFELSCPLLGQLGLKAALESVARRVESGGGPRVQVSGEAPDPALPEPLLGVAYRVARELLMNVQRHAKARHAQLQLRCDAQQFELVVSDDGAGFDGTREQRHFGPLGGYGLVNASAQTQAIGGTLVLQSEPGRGARATLRLPLGAHAALDETARRTSA